MAEPPLFVGGVKVIVAWASPGAAETEVGGSGTVAGVIREYTHSVAPTAVGDVNYPISMSAFISGLSPGTTYWVDVQQLAVTTASEVSMSTVQVICRETL